ncbi:MAG: hypothetical protein ACRD2X_21370, partial [Vicinamibacteraceae bacterium]
MHEHVSPSVQRRLRLRASRYGGRIWRVTRTLMLLTVALLAAVTVSLVTVDLGPSLRARAEREASRRIGRPLHIGRLSIRLLTGRFQLDDVVIEGLTPSARPFLIAEQIDVGLPWWTLFRRELVLDTIEMRDWRMLVETFPGGRHNFPKLGSTSSSRSDGRGARGFVTTVRLVRAVDGHFTYRDHGTPWSTEAANLDIVINKSDKYRGEATFHDGRVRIQDFLPMSAAMRAGFTIEGGLVHFDHIALDTDGARTKLVGSVNLGRWPEQFYRVESRIDFARQRERFFGRQRFRVSGSGDFSGTFRLFKGGHELKGRFASSETGLNAYRFRDLRGALSWTPDRFQVTNVSSQVLGGRAEFDYAIRRPSTRSRQRAGEPRLSRFEAAYRDIDLAAYTDLIELPGLRLAGRASGENVLEYPLGQFEERRGTGHVHVLPPEGVVVQGRALGARVASSGSPASVPLGRVPLAGALTYRYEPRWATFERGELATPDTYVTFAGRTAWGARSTMPFHVTSGDWQASDRLLAGIMTAAGRPTEAIEIGGRGQFDGVLIGAIGQPRIEGRFAAAGMRAWDVVWGRATGDVVVDQGYATVTRGRVRHNGSTIDVDGRFALGFRPETGGDEINARFRLAGRPISDLRHAFGVDDYSLDGHLSGDLRLRGRYEAPLGSGRITVGRGAAWREPFNVASASLRFDGQGVSLGDVNVRKSTGRITGDAYVGWNGTYSFEV